MRVSFLSGAYKNAGDFLIEERGMSLLRHICPGIQIQRFLRSEIRERADEINRCDAIVFGGGPIYMTNLDGYLPLDICLEKFTAPIMILGGGWYGFGGGDSQVHGYAFTDKTLRFLRKAERDGFGLSCRDLHSYRILRLAGFSRVWMTGCPAWYDLDFLNTEEITYPPLQDMDHLRILISDPARTYNLPSALRVVERLMERHSSREGDVRILFHRGLRADRRTLGKPSASLQAFLDGLQRMGVPFEDISSGWEGFHRYDKCDLHVGFRVHAHIYNLGRRNRSILIEEDGRGAAMNQTLGLPGVRAFTDWFQPAAAAAQKALRHLPAYINPHVAEDLDACLDILDATEGQYLKNAFRLQTVYYERMRAYIEQLMKPPRS